MRVSAGRVPAALAAALALVPTGALRAQSAGGAAGLRVASYDFRIALPDSGDTIVARATIDFRRGPRAPDTLSLDLIGLAVDSVVAPSRGTEPVRRTFAYDGRRLTIALPGRDGRDVETVAVFYHGAPSDGLLLGPDGRGREAVFADDWPDRARHWLPTVDDPADKARVTWEVGAPSGWQVVANGRLVRGPAADGGRSWWVYEERRPIPTYTMVLGAGRMTVSRHRPVVNGRDTIPIDVWAEPEDSAFADSVPFRRATEIVETMQRLVGPFRYEKLAHVESSTRYGGMENASAIFYAQGAYPMRRMSEGVVRHETAHQWFGDAVTERDFHDLWLSEGFADYFGLVVGAALDGDSILARGMAGLKAGYLRSPDTGRPLVDTAEKVLTRLLNANSYNKGAWVLHMLRGTVGDSAFWRGIRAYYHTYLDSSVTSAQLQRVMEDASGGKLDWFFGQWLRQPGYPRLDVAWRWDSAGGRVIVDVAQNQPPEWGFFRIPALTIEVVGSDGARARGAFEIASARREVEVRVPWRPADLRADPDGAWLLTAQVHRLP